MSTKAAGRTEAPCTAAAEGKRTPSEAKGTPSAAREQGKKLPAGPFRSAASSSGPGLRPFLPLLSQGLHGPSSLLSPPAALHTLGSPPLSRSSSPPRASPPSPQSQPGIPLPPVTVLPPVTALPAAGIPGDAPRTGWHPELDLSRLDKIWVFARQELIKDKADGRASTVVREISLP